MRFVARRDFPDMAHRTLIRRAIDVTALAPDVLQEAARALKAGLIVGYPTDTVYGLAVHPGRAEAVERLFHVKGRSAEHAIPLIAANTDQVAARVGCLTPLARHLAEQFWPGPVTLVLDAIDELDRGLLGGQDSVAVRVPDHAVARGLAEALDSPITATSANRSGAPSTRSAEEVRATLGQYVHLILDGGASRSSLPSTIVDARGSTPTLIRNGAVPWERVLQSLM